jgi:hypothetical protein
MMLEIKPGVQVGQFRLGMSISETIQYLQHYIRQQNKLFSGFETQTHHSNGGTLESHHQTSASSSSSSSASTTTVTASHHHHQTSSSNNNSNNNKGVMTPKTPEDIHEAIKKHSLSDYIMNKIEIVYDGKNPLRSDTIIKLVDDDIVLRFESKTQRLKFIEVNSVQRVIMSYSGTKFSGQMDDEATFVK